jgi:hypothetical protein
VRYERVTFTVTGKNADEIEREATQYLAQYGGGKVQDVAVSSSPRVISDRGGVRLWEADVEVVFET